MGQNKGIPVPLPPLADADWPPELAHLRDGFVGRGNVYRVMAHHPALLDAWSGLRKHVVTENALGAERIEVVILRAAHRLGAPYEWDHHVVRGRKAGLTDTRIRALAGPLEAMDPADATLASAVDALTADARLPADLQADLTALVGTQGLLDLIATVGFYTTLAFIVNSFDTPLDTDIAEALARRPFG
jgi:alkylhydroperoxidase family enzyme